VDSGKNQVNPTPGGGSKKAHSKNGEGAGGRQGTLSQDLIDLNLIIA